MEVNHLLETDNDRKNYIGKVVESTRHGKYIILGVHSVINKNKYYVCEFESTKNKVKANRYNAYHGRVDDSNLVGRRFERLLVIERSEEVKKYGKIYWKCQCDCGKIVHIGTNQLNSGGTKSCGCYKLDRTKETATKHGMKYTKFYRTWRNMRDRCENPKNKKYNNYGGRGIKIQDSWKENFINFRDDMYEKYLIHSKIHGEKNTTLDRINPDGDYCLENCEWKTWEEQYCNKSKKNKLGVRGVYYNEYSYISTITFKRQAYHIGSYDTLDEAILARLNAEVLYYGYDKAPQRNLFEKYNILLDK